ncbi:TOBE domain-containing protein, partial [Micromonospora aurantiaca]|nr:TOBE domain-containing protein [Micromonospora aurantiaca]
SNLLGGEIAEAGPGSAVISYGPDGRIEVPIRNGLKVAAGERLELTVRPEKIGIGPDRPADDLCGVRGTVTEVVYLGTSTNYNITTSAGSDVVVFLQNA